MVARPSTTRKAPSVCTWDGSLPGDERESVSDIRGDQEVIPRLELCIGSARGREDGLEAERVKEEGDRHRFGCSMEDNHWGSHR